jgi:hypothetical protein
MVMLLQVTLIPLLRILRLIRGLQSGYCTLNPLGSIWFSNNIKWKSFFCCLLETCISKCSSNDVFFQQLDKYYWEVTLSTLQSGINNQRIFCWGISNQWCFWTYKCIFSICILCGCITYMILGILEQLQQVYQLHLLLEM